MIRFIPLILFLLFLGGCSKPSVYDKQFLQFGTLIEVSLVSDTPETAEKLFTQIEGYLSEKNQQWHGWREGTLMTFNKNLLSRPSTEVPPELTELIELSNWGYKNSEGRFNPAMGKLIAAWGFHAKQQPDRATIERIQADIPTMDDLVIEQGMAHSLNPELQLDFGAVAKGLAVKQIAELIRQAGINDFIINAGGDIQATGKHLQRNWKVGIEDPFSEGVIGGVDVSNASVFTSGNYRRFYIDEQGQKRHHIINPFTGNPSEQISASTVITDDPAIADIAATTLMLTDIENLKHITNLLGIQKFLLISESGTAYLSPQMQQMISWEPGNQLEVVLIQ